MAKGNMLLGYSRGSVGDVTFSRVKGQQVQKARNRNPNNPKTYSQVLQRAYFSSAVLFYKTLQQVDVRLAFEDKKVTESDYNAFMRHNVSRVLPISFKRTQSGTPLMMPLQASDGSLPSLNGVASILANAFSFIKDVGSEEEVTTAGQFFTNFCNATGLQNGDYITIYLLAATDMSGDDTLGDAVDGVDYKNIVPVIGQIQIDTTSKLSLESFNTSDASSNITISVAGSEYEFQMNTQDIGSIVGNRPLMYVTIASRKADNVTKVSTEYFSLYGGSKTEYEQLSGSLNESYVAAVMQSNGYNIDPVLNGSLVD